MEGKKHLTTSVDMKDNRSRESVGGEKLGPMGYQVTKIGKVWENSSLAKKGG